MRSDVAIPRKRAPEEGRSRRLRSREAPIRENGGTFLPTTRPDDLSQHDRRHRLATSPLGQGAPSDRIPASSRPTPGRGIRTALWDGADACGVCPAGPTEVGPTNDPKRTGRQVLMRTAWPPISITGAGRTEMRQLQRPTPDSPPWEEPRPPADPRHRRYPCWAGLGSGRGPTLSRTGGIVTRIRHRNNRSAGIMSQILVHGFPNSAQFIGRLSTELSTKPRSR